MNLASVITLVVGSVMGLYAKILFDKHQRTIEKREKLKILNNAQNLLKGILIECKEHLKQDWDSDRGVYYKNQMAEEIRIFSRESRDAIGGIIFFKMIQVSAGLETFSMKNNNDIPEPYSCDEVIADLCLILMELVKKTVKDENDQNLELEKLEREFIVNVNGAADIQPWVPTESTPKQKPKHMVQE